MQGRPFQVSRQERDMPSALKEAYQEEGDLELRTSLHGLWLLRSGWRLTSIAAAVGVHYRTVQTRVGWYRKGGVEAVISHKMGRKGQVVNGVVIMDQWGIAFTGKCKRMTKYIRQVEENGEVQKSGTGHSGLTRLGVIL